VIYKLFDGLDPINALPAFPQAPILAMSKINQEKKLSRPELGK